MQRLQQSETITIILSCYNNWETVWKSLCSFEAQDDKNFRVILADDGSDSSFRERFDAMAVESPLDLLHVWHEDSGYRKAVILNKAAAMAATRYLLFTDGDILVRGDWVGAHRNLARHGRFIAGGSHLNISEGLHGKLTREDILDQRVFDAGWLRHHGEHLRPGFRLRLSCSGVTARILDFLTPRYNSFVGCNSGCWKADFEAADGFDETFGYSAEDRDFGVRLANRGVLGMRHRYTLACVHLDHRRPYLDPEEVARCRALIRKRRRSRVVSWKK